VIPHAHSRPPGALTASGQRPVAGCIDVRMRRLAPLLALLACPGSPTTTTTDAPTTTAASTSTDTTDAITTGDPGLQRCVPTCRVDTDCYLDSKDIGFACVAGVCAQPPCVDDLGCQALASAWTTPCASPDECPDGQTCVDIGDATGRCALLLPLDFTCADLGLAELTRPELPSARPVAVCGNDDATCTDAACKDPCSSDADCPAELGHPHCEVESGECRCSADLECASTMEPGFTACLAGRCGCQLDADCLGGDNVDTCMDGACGCSSTATCSDPVFDHATPICQTP
jgi:hypothetical protein